MILETWSERKIVDIKTMRILVLGNSTFLVGYTTDINLQVAWYKLCTLQSTHMLPAVKRVP